MDPAINLAVARLAGWLEGMRAPDGYAGPVVHWWRDSLLYCGAALDWRYEEIIAGYLTLFATTGDERWLARAKRAGDDLVGGQRPDGTFRNSCFELNPGSAGRPHEAAADVGLLLLAAVLRTRQDPEADVYGECAARNLTSLYLGRLWSEREGRIRDGEESFVPNKAATAIEALCLLAEQGRGGDVSRVVAATADAILEHQVVEPGERLDGAIAQSTIRGRRVSSFFPFYVARCVSGLEAAYRALGDRRFLDGALRAAAFVERWRDADGGWPQVIYGSGRVNPYPRWVAGAGEAVRAFAAVRPYGFEAASGPTVEWLLAGQLPSGGIRTAEGFGSQVSQRAPNGPPDFRDALGVAGWNDKAFRALAGLATEVETEPGRSAVDLECTWRGRPARYLEDADSLEVVTRRTVHYRWRKGDSWASLQPAPRLQPTGVA